MLNRSSHEAFQRIKVIADEIKIRERRAELQELLCNPIPENNITLFRLFKAFTGSRADTTAGKNPAGISATAANKTRAPYTI